MDLFERVPGPFREPLGLALDLVPARCLELVQPRFLCGVSPVFVGLHDRVTSPELQAFDSDLTWHEWPHALFQPGLEQRPRADRQPTVVFPTLERREAYAQFDDLHVQTFLHEVGHLVDEALGFSLETPWGLAFSSSRIEAVAHAFQITLAPPDGEWVLCAASESWRPLREAIGA